MNVSKRGNSVKVVKVVCLKKLRKFDSKEEEVSLKFGFVSAAAVASTSTSEPKKERERA